MAPKISGAHIKGRVHADFIYPNHQQSTLPRLTWNSSPNNFCFSFVVSHLPLQKLTQEFMDISGAISTTPLLGSSNTRVQKCPFSIVRSEQTCNQIAKSVMHRSYTSVFLWKPLWLCMGLTTIRFSIVLPVLKTHLVIQNFQLQRLISVLGTISLKQTIKNGFSFMNMECTVVWLGLVFA